MSQKSPRPTGTLFASNWPSSFSQNGSLGTEGEVAAHRIAFIAGSAPNDCCPRSGAYGGTKAKPLASTHLGRRLCCLWSSAFLCWASLREQSIRGHIHPRLTLKAGDRPPYGLWAQNFGLDLLERRGLFLRAAAAQSENLTLRKLGNNRQAGAVPRASQ
jgi:hypothetical protein